MAGSVTDQKHLSWWAWCPVLIKAFSKSSNNIFRQISSTWGINLGNEIFDLIDIARERLDRVSLSIAVVSVPHETDSDLQAISGGNNVLNNLMKSLFCSINQRPHWTSAVAEQTKLKKLGSFGCLPCFAGFFLCSCLSFFLDWLWSLFLGWCGCLFWCWFLWHFVFNYIFNSIKIGFIIKCYTYQNK